MPITFRVNLETVNKYSARQPYNLLDDGDNFRDTRSTWFPDRLINNRKLKHNDEFTVSGMNSLYLRDNYTEGEFKFLDVV